MGRSHRAKGLRVDGAVPTCRSNSSLLRRSSLWRRRNASSSVWARRNSADSVCRKYQGAWERKERLLRLKTEGGHATTQCVLGVGGRDSNPRISPSRIASGWREVVAETAALGRVWQGRASVAREAQSRRAGYPSTPSPLWPVSTVKQSVNRPMRPWDTAS